MKRRNFLSLSAFLAVGSTLKNMASPLSISKSSKDIYEWRIYDLTNDGDTLDRFYQEVLIPAYNKAGIKVGAFKLFKENGTPKRYYLFTYPDIATYLSVKNALWENKKFKSAARPFYDATAPQPVYSNFETFLCEAIDRVPHLLMPAGSRTLFELRTYWSPNEEANERKVSMFNKEEINLFDKVGIHSVCYGKILAGPRMPALMYLTWYNDLAAREAAWKAFGSHPDWKAMKDKKEYAYTATANKSVYLTPLAYSQL